ncbi:uncharacterized protein EDB93DRAFT_74477 [Suillus bovinus]|uniref:uncharacterized protein n=1 Tax=Suillus bovinus TaxID=48563 RepID=UPI001B885C90|nr:uncharacterized protein EDB93DRAFT_200623 [Suillus bovinus]XP_041302243.1 uncharacterized protein EDB93DRAFT_74477 [Suillus bovinus]KAG2127637.1 hypothetical protein EDB93DRAFT_200623 [Suillus bovinus]KAG2130802.1 hypothetical protein EDB93DRAFT_74477 [Suillus bovinus]
MTILMSIQAFLNRCGASFYPNAAAKLLVYYCSKKAFTSYGYSTRFPRFMDHIVVYLRRWHRPLRGHAPSIQRYVPQFHQHFSKLDPRHKITIY